MRNFLATIAGFVVGGVVNVGVMQANAQLYPLPEGTSMNDPAALSAWVSTLPTSAFGLVLLAHSGQAAVGGFVASRLATGRSMVPALIIGGLTAVASGFNMTQLPAPAWMWIDLPLNLVAGWVGGRLVQPRS
jgi:hypothetical protein